MQQEEILELIDLKDFHQLKHILSDMLVPDVAEILQEVEEPANVIRIFRLLPKDMGAEVFAYIDEDLQEIIVNYLTDKELAFIMEELYTDDAVNFLEEMPANVIERALKVSTPETRKVVNKFLSYEEDTAGAIMTSEFLDVGIDMTVAEALKRVKKIAQDVQTMNCLFVVDNKKTLKGVVSIKDFILADPTLPIVDIMDDNIVFANVNEDQEQIGLTFQKYDIQVLPVVDKENRLVGMITSDDVMEVIEEEATEDIQQMAGIVSTDKPYLKTSVLQTMLTRLPWLVILMVSATFTGIIINAYETTLSSLLFACVPMLMGTGGNAGSQASITITRGIALNEIEFKDFFRVIWKEVRVSILTGLLLAIVCFGKLQLIDRLIFGYDYTVLVSLAVSLALFGTVFIAKFVGSMLPLLAKKVHLDPAVVASPFITTIVDVLSLIVYCSISIAILGA